MPQFLSRFPARSRDAMMRKMLELSLKELPADLQDAAIAFLLNAYRTCCLQGCVNAQALSQSCQMLVAFGTHLLDEVLKDDPLLVPWLMTLQELVLSIEALTTRRCRHDMQTCTINMQTPTLEIGVTETRDTETGKTNRGRSALSEAQMKSARKLVENLVSRLGTERRVNSDDQTVSLPKGVCMRVPSIVCMRNRCVRAMWDVSSRTHVCMHTSMHAHSVSLSCRVWTWCCTIVRSVYPICDQQAYTHAHKYTHAHAHAHTHTCTQLQMETLHI